MAPAEEGCAARKVKVLPDREVGHLCLDVLLYLGVGIKDDGEEEIEHEHACDNTREHDCVRKRSAVGGVRASCDPVVGACP